MALFFTKQLVKSRLLHRQLVLVANVGDRLVLLVFKAVLFLLDMLDATALFHADIIEGFYLGGGFFDGGLVLGRADNILKIFEETVFVFVASLRLHLSNRLDLALKNQESFVVKIDTAVAKESGDRCKVGFFAIDVIFAGVVLESFSGNDELGVRDNLMAATGLGKLVQGRKRTRISYLIHDLLEVDGDLAMIQIRKLC